MINNIAKYKQKLRTPAILAATIGIVLLAIALFLVIWWGISFSAGLESALRTIMIIAGIAVIPSVLYFLMKQRNKYRVFCDIYADPIMPKHSPKIMFYSLIKYLAVIFSLIAATHGILIAPMLFVWVMILIHVPAYIKLWKYHGYSVSVLLFLSGITVTVSVLLAPFARAGLWTIADMFLRFFNI